MEDTSLLQGVEAKLFDFGLFLTVMIVIFSSIGLGGIGIGSYAMLRDDWEKPKDEKNKINLKRLFR